MYRHADRQLIPNKQAKIFKIHFQHKKYILLSGWNCENDIPYHPSSHALYSREPPKVFRMVEITIQVRDKYITESGMPIIPDPAI
jgi:hypothetical protein